MVARTTALIFLKPVETRTPLQSENYLSEGLQLGLLSTNIKMVFLGSGNSYADRLGVV
jgi:hypothetical protein